MKRIQPVSIQRSFKDLDSHKTFGLVEGQVIMHVTWSSCSIVIQSRTLFTPGLEPSEIVTTPSCLLPLRRTKRIPGQIMSTRHFPAQKNGFRGSLTEKMASQDSSPRDVRHGSSDQWVLRQHQRCEACTPCTCSPGSRYCTSQASCSEVHLLYSAETWKICEVAHIASPLEDVGSKL